MKREPLWRRYLRFWGPDVHRDIDEELDFHLEMRAEEYEAAGLSPEAARDEARRRFGNAEAVRSECHALGEKRIHRWRRSQWWESLAYDVRYAVRGLRRQPGFTAVVVLTLALGIGANAVMFGVIDRLLLEPPAGVRDAGAVKRVYQTLNFPVQGPTTQAEATYPDYVMLRDHGDAFASVAAYTHRSVTYGQGHEAQHVPGALATSGFFSLLGVRPMLGRFFTADEDRPPSGTRVAVLGFDFWRRQFGSDPNMIGKVVDLDHDPYTIIGVLPEGFTGIDMDMEPVDIWVPMSAGALSRKMSSGWYQTRNQIWLEILVRLRPGVSLEHATTQATTLFRRSLAEDARRPASGAYDSDATASMTLGSLVTARGPLRTSEAQSARIALWLGGVAAIVLLIACANVANLLLARSARRRREIAVRLALGVGRGRLVRQLLTESLMLAMLGAVAALVLARWGGVAFRVALLPDVAWRHSPVSARVLGVTAAITVVTGLLAGLAPAFQASRPDVVGSLKAGAREGAFRRTRTRSALLIAQAALSVVLLVGAGLFVRSLTRVAGQDMGFDTRSVLLVNAALYSPDYTAEQTRNFYQLALERVQHVPGVIDAARATSVPFRSASGMRLYIPGHDSIPHVADGGPYDVKVTPGYFATLGTRIVRGRGFTDADVKGAPLVAVVSETMARMIWPGERAIGKCMKLGDIKAPCTEVVGLAEDAHRWNIHPVPVMQYYLPIAQSPTPGASGALFVRVAGDPADHIAAVRNALQTVSPDKPVVDVQPLQSVIDPSIRPWRLSATMFTVFGALSLIIAAVGLYGVVTYDVSQRGHEFGVRMALGAQRRDILRLVLLDGVRLAAIGTAVGALIGLALSRFVAPLLFETSPRDPFVFGTVVLVLLTVAVIASVLPGHRATRVDPAEALRTE